MPTKTLYISLASLMLVLFGGWYIYNNNQVSLAPVVLSQSGSGLVSDLTNPFGSGGSSSGSEEGISDKTGSILTTTGTTEIPEIVYNTTWTPRTLSGVYYQFGVGNPKETDKSVEELMEMNKKCLNWDPSCDILISRFGEQQGGIIHEDGTVGLDGENPARMTPEIEYLAYSFLSNPVIRQSSEKCSEFFWNFEQAYAVYHHEVSDLGDSSEEYGTAKWWNPYNIDINDIIRIHPSTGRKELNTNIIATLNTQIQSPSIKEGGRYHTNIQLTECLTQNNILTPLQAHVDRHYRDLMWLWREWKPED